MITHVIYEIVGRKVGCAKDFEKRMQKYELKEGVRPLNVHILEELHDATDQYAGDREWYWADKLKYPRGVHYTVTMGMIEAARVSPNRFSIGTLPPEERASIAGSGGSKAFEMGVGIHAMSSEEKAAAGAKGVQQRLATSTHEERSAVGRKAGKAGGRARMDSMTAEERSALGRLAAQAANDKISPEQRRDYAGRAGRRAAELGVSGFMRRAKCPHCGKEGNLPSLKRWHFDNCPHKSVVQPAERGNPSSATTLAEGVLSPSPRPPQRDGG